MTAKEIAAKLKSLASPKVAKSSSRFFKTGPGEYGEGDVFQGIKVPTLRKIAREFKALPTAEIVALFTSPIHEQRQLALFIMVLQATKGDAARRKALFELYMENRRSVNNWDLVDCSAPQLVGGYLMDRSRRPLLELVKSRSLWDRRIAVIATQHFIRHGQFDDTLTISERLLEDKADLIHKAVGWMLREVGQKDQSLLEAFLDQHGTNMPRTMLRYAIERLPPNQRRFHLSRK